MNLDLEAVLARARAASQSGATSADPAQAQQRAQLARVAQEFESMLIGQMLREMRKTESWGGEEDSGASGSAMGAGFGAETFNDTIDAELSSFLAKAQGIGLSQQLLQAFDRMAGDAAAPGASGLKMGAPSVVAGSASQDPAYVPSVVADRGAVIALPDDRGANPLGSPGGSAMLPVIDESATLASRSQTAVADPPEVVTSAFGWRKDPFTGQMKFHRGVDLAATYGQDVQAAAAGTVVFSGEQRGYGTTVMIQHADGTRTRYAHLSSAIVQPGQVVGAGQTVGHAGHSGRATGTHLHFEVIGPDGQAMSPESWTGSRG
jgi:murein DD-endopeptidase MepM/ murein hydrolase activator NlpD